MALALFLILAGLPQAGQIKGNSKASLGADKIKTVSIANPVLLNPVAAPVGIGSLNLEQVKVSGKQDSPEGLPSSALLQPSLDPASQPQKGQQGSSEESGARSEKASKPIAAPGAGDGPPSPPAPVSTFEDPHYFLRVLVRLGVPAELVNQLAAYLDDPLRHPGDQGRVYHGRAHTYDVPNLMAILLDAIPADQADDQERISALLAAAFHDIDPNRPALTPPSVSETLKYMRTDQETLELLGKFAQHLGLPLETLSAKLSTRAKKTDYDPDPQARAKIEEDFSSMVLAETQDLKAQERIRRISEVLAFADKTATYLFLDATAEEIADYVRNGTVPEKVRLAVLNLAEEFRNGIKAGRMDPRTIIPSVEGTYGFLSQFLAKSPHYALLPQGLRLRFDGTLEYFKARQIHDRPAAGVNESARGRAPPSREWKVLEGAREISRQLDPHTESIEPILDLINDAKAYIRGIMDSKQPTDQQLEALLADYMEQKGIDPDSRPGQSLRKAVIPSRFRSQEGLISRLDPRFQGFGTLILELSRRHGVTPAYLESLIKKSKELMRRLAGLKAKAHIESILEELIHRDRLEKAVSRYPENAQGDLMRLVVMNMAAPSGASDEEISRDGVFVSVSLSGRRILSAEVDRHPDPQKPHVVYYIRFEDGKWRITVYRQNTRRGFPGGPDSEFIQILKQWLVSGGIPESDFVE